MPNKKQVTIQISVDTRLLDELQRSLTLSIQFARTGMDSLKPEDHIALAVLRAARPELFKKETQ